MGELRERWIWGALGAVVTAVVAAGVWSLIDRQADADLPVLAEVPAFALTERSGRSVTEAELEGLPWVADFIFTQCSGVCPVLSSRMAGLQRALKDARIPARLVSFSVDPTRDSPEVLRGYAERFRADPQGWLFLTGDRRQLYSLVGEGFQLSVAERAPDEAEDSTDLITHSDRFVLVDSDLQIRGYYHGTDEDVVERVISDLRRLNGEGPAIDR